MLASLFLTTLLAVGSTADPTKPVWPEEFSSPFGLFLNFPKVVNASSDFYYDWTVSKASLIDYKEKCINAIPLLSPGSPCKLYFNLNGTYLSQPSLGKQCCSLFPGIGPVPPAFLAGFTYNGTASALDYQGQSHQCNFWNDPTGFGYWTDIKTDFDIYFRDGPTGTFWAWGDFNVTSQDASLFSLPGTADECAKSCFSIYDDDGEEQDIEAHRMRVENAKSSVSDPYLRLALSLHEQKTM